MPIQTHKIEVLVDLLVALLAGAGASDNLIDEGVIPAGDGAGAGDNLIDEGGMPAGDGAGASDNLIDEEVIPAGAKAGRSCFDILFFRTLLMFGSVDRIV
jgi:hypothetical protein